MIQMMMATIGGASTANTAQRQHVLMLRKTVGFAIASSGLAVIVAQALQHALGG